MLKRSYAISYHAEIAYFIQLLELQFAKTFGEWCGTEQEAAWMDGLRQEARACTKVARGKRALGRNLDGAVVDAPAKPDSTAQGLREITSRLTAMRLSNTSQVRRSAGIWVETGNGALFVAQRILDQAKPLHKV